MKIAINGLGRIGRAVLKIALDKGIKVVAINDLTDAPTLAHLLQYDTVYGKYDKKVEAVKGGIMVGGQKIPVLGEPDPAKLPWQKMKIDVVLECTGFFTTTEKAGAHLNAGAKRVLISAPAKDEITQTMVLGTQDTADCLKTKKCDQIIAMASCTTNCISPVMQVLESQFGVAKALMTTIHSYTASQNLVDGPHKDLRRARAAAQNIILTTTGAAVATTKVMPKMKNKFDGIAMRVPTVCGSVSDITAVLKTKTTAEEINQAFKKFTRHPMYKKILAVSEEPLVSSDFIGNSHSTIIDLEFTRVVGGNLVKILAWYDNEWAYSNRLVELAQMV